MIHNETALLTDSLASSANVLTSEDAYVSRGHLDNQDCYRIFSSMSTVYIITRIDFGNRHSDLSAQIRSGVCQAIQSRPDLIGITRLASPGLNHIPVGQLTRGQIEAYI